ncbi:MAG: hotdog family protein [Xanthomonadaceae bacterium]|nr:hotdog family protein [Xanthomonadaceae bacterium]
MELGAAILDIEQVLPHRGSMRLVDRVLHWDAERIAVAVQVPVDGPFHAEGGVPAHVGIEYMAQAVACWAGCQARRRGLPPPLGFLLGSRRYVCTVPVFASGWLLQVEARREIMGDNGLGVFACRIVCESRELAQANVSVFEPSDAQAYLSQQP